MNDNPTMQELLGTLLQSEFAKLQSHLEAAEKVCLEAEEWHWGTHHSKCPFEECLTCQALDNWRRAKEGK